MGSAQKQYARRVALYALRDDDGRVLLWHRPPEMVWLGDHWVFFGGALQEGETAERAVVRMMAEDLTFTPEHLHLFKRYEFQELDGLHERTVFTAELPYDLEKLKKKMKTDREIGLFSFEDILSLKVSGYDFIILKDLFGK